MGEENLQERIKELISELGGANGGRTVGNAINELTKIGKPAVPALVEVVEDWDWIQSSRENWKKRKNAAYVLGEIGDSRAVPVLLDAFFDVDWTDRLPAALEYADSWKVPILIEAMIGQSLDIFEVIAKVLGKLKDPTAVPALVGALKNKHPQKSAAWKLWEGLRENAAWVLGEIGHTSAIPALIDSLKDGNPYMRENAAHALRKIFPNCETIKELKEFETNLLKVQNNLKKRFKDQDFQDVRMKIAWLRIAIAKRENQLSQDKGVLLDDKPKLPNRSGIYRTHDTAPRTVRRQTNG